MNLNPSNMTVSPIGLPGEILYRIRTFLPHSDNGRLTLASRYFASLDGWNQEVWKHYLFCANIPGTDDPVPDYRKIFCDAMKKKVQLDIPEDKIPLVDLVQLSRSPLHPSSKTMERIIFYRNSKGDEIGVKKMAKELARLSEDQIKKIYSHLLLRQPSTVVSAYKNVRLPEVWDNSHLIYAKSSGITLPSS